MALPTGVLGHCTMCVELSTNGTTWTDFSDYLTVLEPDEMSRVTGEAYVFGEDIPQNMLGKRESFTVRIRGMYADSTATTNPFSYVWAQWTTSCGGALAVRWAPAGCATTNQVFSTATATGHQSELINLMPPSGDASSGDPLIWEAVVKGNELYRATYA